MEKNKIFEIDRDRYKISDKNFHTEEVPKSMIIIGSTNRKSNYYLIRQQKKENTLSSDWNTYTISREGNIYEHYNPMYYSDFIGDVTIDMKSVSILLENMGPLYYNDNTEHFYNDLNERFEGGENDVFKKEWRGYKYYEPYTKEQYDAIVYLCRVLCLELNISDDSYGHNAYEDFSHIFKGIITRSNLDMNSSDPNPSFDFKKFYKDLKK
jgi:N-acetyl-anhydromuramyl-L-alanine amidase AmpD